MIVLIIRYLTENDASEHEKVSSQSFIYTYNPAEKQELPSELMLGAFADENKTLMADMEIGDRKNHFGNGTLKCAAVGGVASKPEYRNRGAVRKMFEELFSEEKWDISILYPFSNSYYRKFGYESVGRAVSLKVSFSELKSCEKNADVTLCEENNADKLVELYNKIAQKNNLCFVRETSENFDINPYETGIYTYMWHDENGEYQSYASYTVDRENSEIKVKEIGYLTPESLKGIIGFLRSYEGNQSSVLFSKLPINSPVVRLVENECKAEMKQSSVGAARVLNVENVLKTKKYPASKGKFVVKCEDSIDRNNACFTVEYENGTGNVTKDADCEPDVIMTPNAFSEIFLYGICSPESVDFINGLTVKKQNEDFFSAFTCRNSYFTDEF